MKKTLKNTITEISKLNPKPGSSYAGNNKIAEQIVPDFSYSNFRWRTRPNS
jgi:RNA polymerase sigma-54 factor